MLRRYSILVIALLALSACGLGQQTPTATVSPEPGAAQATTADAAEPGADGDGVVTIGFGAQEWERATYEPLIKQFNEQNPDVQVQFVSTDEVMNVGDQPWDYNEIQRRIVSAADTATLWSVGDQAIENGLYTNLTPLMDADASFDRSDFYNGALESVTKGDGIYTLPRTMNIPLLSYNKDLWAQRGVPEPAPDWTWNDMVAAAEQLAEKRGDEFEVYGILDWGDGTSTLYRELSTRGMNLWQSDPATLRVDDEEFVAAVERVAELARSGAIYVQTDEGDAFNDFQKLILDQKVGMWQPDMLAFGGPEPTEPSFAVGTVPYPHDELSSFSSGQGYVISGGTQHPEASWRWIAFLSEQVIKDPHNETVRISELPARKSIAEQSGYWDALDESATAAVQAVIERPTQPRQDFGSFNPPQDFYQSLSTALSAVIKGEKDAAVAMTEVQNTLEESLAKQAETTTPAAATGPIVVATPVVEVAAEGATKIVFKVIGGDDSAIRRMARTFNENNPDLFVEVQNFDFSGNEGPVMSNIAAEADCFSWWGPPGTDEFTATLDLQPLIDADADFPQDDYPAALLAPFQKDGALHGLPYSVDLLVLHYNKTAFEQAGLELPNADWTLDDLVNAAQQLTSGDGTTKQYGYASIGSQTQELDFFLEHLGAKLTTGADDNEQPDYTDPKVQEAVQSYLTLLRDFSPNTEIQGYSQGGWSGDFYQLTNEGRVGMWFEFGIRFFGDTSQDFERAIAPPPLSDGPLRTNSFFSPGLYISPETENAQACWSWLKALSSDISGFENAGFPARISVAESEEFIQQARPGAAEVYAAYKEALSRPPSEEDDPRRTFDPDRVYVDTFWFYRAVDRALQGEGELDRELAEAQRLTEEYLTCARGGVDGAACARQVDPEYEGFQSVAEEE